MTKLFLSALLLVSAAMADQAAGKLNVNCIPAPMAGGVNVFLKGSIDLVVRASTGATKAKDGAMLTLTLNNETQKIPVQGIFLMDKFDGTMDSDGPRIITEIKIDSKDTPTSQRSYVSFPNGKKALMNCGKH